MISMMFMGHVGPLTLAVALARDAKAAIDIPRGR